MKPRGLFLAAAAVGAALVVALLLDPGIRPTRACPAVGYAYVGHVELVFAEEPASVAACFGDGCIPATVAQDPGGKWLVPQSRPYLIPPVSVTSVYVEASPPLGAPIARTLPIETESTGEYPYGRECGGPFTFKPVQVPNS